MFVYCDSYIYNIMFQSRPLQYISDFRSQALVKLGIAKVGFMKEVDKSKATEQRRKSSSDSVKFPIPQSSCACSE